jgi:riboflavin transporter FmnP
VKLDQTPSFRKVIIPWYDSELACFLAIAFLLMVVFFSAVGISVARAHTLHSGMVWIPALLLALSMAALVTITVRLVRRYLDRYRG